MLKSQHNLQRKIRRTYPWYEMDRAWRLLFFGEHHDALPGTDTDNVTSTFSRAGMRRLRSAGSISTRQRRDCRAYRHGVQSAESENVIPIVIFNSLNWTRTDAMEVHVKFEKPVKAFKVVDADGKTVAFQFEARRGQGRVFRSEHDFGCKDIPSLGYRVFMSQARIYSRMEAIRLRQPGRRLFLRMSCTGLQLTRRRGGDITSLFAKKLNKEFIDTTAGLGNEILALEEGKNSYADVLDITGKFWRSGDIG